MIRFQLQSASHGTRTKAALGLAAVLCTACGAGPDAPAKTSSARPSADEAGFIVPPQAQTLRRLQDGGLVLTGTAPAGAVVRLASPAGSAFAATADDKGRWSITAPALARPALFGLSATSHGRTVQAQGYIALLPKGGSSALGALLRAGAGALPLGPTSERVRITALDLDAARAAIVSGAAPTGAVLAAAVDGVAAGEGAAAADGGFALSLIAPVELGPRRIEVSGPAASAAATVEVRALSRPAPLPYRSERATDAWLIDWITPGGGVQTTYLFDSPGPGA